MPLYKIKKSNIDNKGLVAAKDIKKGTKIIEYKGKLISKKESEVNPKFDNSKRIYLFEIKKLKSLTALILIYLEQGNLKFMVVTL